MCKAILQASEGLGLRNRGAKTSKQSHRGRLGFVDELPHGILLEVCFMDNEDDLIKVQNVKRWAEAIGTAMVGAMARYACKK